MQRFNHLQVHVSAIYGHALPYWSVSDNITMVSFLIVGAVALESKSHESESSQVRPPRLPTWEIIHNIFTTLFPTVI